MSAPWFQALQDTCRKSSQSRVAARIGYSPAVINQVLKGTYKGDMERVRMRIEGALLHQSVECPVLGEIEKHICQDNQAKPFAATNPTRVALYRACRNGCPHSTLEGAS